MSKLNFKKRSGVIIAIIQDYQTGEVLMHAFMNPEAVQKTIATGEFWRWSTEHNQLQRKGATSNSVMEVKEILIDCDGDAVVIRVEITGLGNACHLGCHSCFVAVDLTGQVNQFGGYCSRQSCGAEMVETTFGSAFPRRMDQDPSMLIWCCPVCGDWKECK